MDLRLDSELEGAPGPILELPFGPEFLYPLPFLELEGQVYRRPVTVSSRDLT